MKALFRGSQNSACRHDESAAGTATRLPLAMGCAEVRGHGNRHHILPAELSA
jgi:hypothetical protein